MRRFKRGILFGAVLFGLLLTGLTGGWAQMPTAFDQTPLRFRTADLLPGNMLQGTNYTVGPTVENDGFVHTFALQTKYGSYRLETTELLQTRINELIALKHMEAVERSDVFKEALKKGAKAPLFAAKSLVTQPVATVKGTVSGIGRWFSDVGRSIVSDDPHQENVLKTALGYATVKRQFAYQYGIDPYTRFEPLQKQLAKIARAGFAGGLTPRLAFQAIPRTAGVVVRGSSTANSMRKLVMDKSPAELHKINRQKLLAMGTTQSTTDAFLDNPYYNPQEATLLVGELDNMRTVSGRALFIGAAALADQTSVARYMRLRAQMAGSYVAQVAPAERFVEVNGVPFLMRKDDVVIGLFPLDHVAWTPLLHQKLTTTSRAVSQLPGLKGREVWLEGTVSAAARQALEAAGWVVKEKVGAQLKTKSQP